MSKVSLAAVLLFGALVAANAAAAPHTAVSCPFDSSGGGDATTRGFYVTNYPARSIDKVTLEYGAFTAGTYKITLTARKRTYDGRKIGARTASVSLSSPSATKPVSFTFRARVRRGSSITFKQTTVGPGTVFFNNGVGPCHGVTETTNTRPPLSTFHRDSVGLTITGS
jgi:hypothetical protein